MAHATIDRACRLLFAAEGNDDETSGNEKVAAGSKKQATLAVYEAWRCSLEPIARLERRFTRFEGRLSPIATRAA